MPGHEDLSDHDELRYDSLMVVFLGKFTARRQDCAPVATRNRLELSRNETSPIARSPTTLRRPRRYTVACAKIIKTRGSYPSDETALKLLYLAVKNTSMRWPAG